MPTSEHTINLIRNKSAASPQTEAIEASIKKASTVTLSIFVGVSVILASVYFLFYYQLNGQEEQKRDLITRVNSLKNKEAYLLAIKARTKTVEKVMANQKPWVEMLDLVYTFAAPPSLSSISVDEQNKILLTIRTQTLEEILRIVQAIASNVEANKIKNPQLVSFQLVKNGFFEISVSFFAVFGNI